MLSTGFCQSFVLSPIRTVLECLIVPILFLAYLPQYIKVYRLGTADLTSRFMLCLCLFSTLQLAARLINPIGLDGVRCILYRKELHGMQAFSALIGYFEVLSQWLCVMIWLFFFVRFRTSAQDAERAPLLAEQRDTGTVNPPSSASTKSLDIPSDQLGFIIAVHAIFFLGTTFGMLVSPRASGSQGVGGPLFQSMAIDGLNVLCIVFGFGLAIALCVVQVRDAFASPRALGISRFSLALQILALLVLAFMQLFRPHVSPTFDSWRTQFWGLYFDRWGVAVNYFIMIVGDILALLTRRQNYSICECK